MRSEVYEMHIKDYPEDTELINKSIPNFKKLVCIFGGVMPQTRRRRWKRSSGDSSWPPQEQMTGGLSSHATPPRAPSCVNWDDDMDDFMPPNHGLEHLMFLPLYMNLEPEKREKESREVRQVMLHHLQHHYLSTGMTI